MIISWVAMRGATKWSCDNILLVLLTYDSKHRWDLVMPDKVFSEVQSILHSP